MKQLQVGDLAPDFSLQSQKGARLSLSDFKGKTVVLFFYPKDMTSGCTMEACGFRDREAEFRKSGAIILGVSPDRVRSHAKFADKYQLPFDLLADEEKSVIKAYGVWVEKSMYGVKYMGVERATFVIGPKGDIQGVFRKVKPANHAQEVLHLLGKVKLPGKA